MWLQIKKIFFIFVELILVFLSINFFVSFILLSVDVKLRGDFLLWFLEFIKLVIVFLYGFLLFLKDFFKCLMLFFKM